MMKGIIGSLKKKKKNFLPFSGRVTKLGSKVFCIPSTQSCSVMESSTGPLWSLSYCLLSQETNGWEIETLNIPTSNC